MIEVALDSADLAAELAVLRKTATALEPGGLRSLLLIPDAQIKYLTLHITSQLLVSGIYLLRSFIPFFLSSVVFFFLFSTPLFPEIDEHEGSTGEQIGTYLEFEENPLPKLE